jgi:penicillin-binding protein 1B
MNRAIKLPQYSDMKPFTAPPGVEIVRVDRNTWLPADDTCPEDYTLAFLDGTVPSGTCSHMGVSSQTVMQGLYPNGAANANSAPAVPAQNSPDTTQPTPPKKKNIFQKIFGGGDKPVEPALPPRLRSSL